MKKKKQKPGPEADHLVIDDDWKKAIGKAVSIEKPDEGWPNPDEAKPSDSEEPEKN